MTCKQQDVTTGLTRSTCHLLTPPTGHSCAGFICLAHSLARKIRKLGHIQVKKCAHNYTTGRGHELNPSGKHLAQPSVTQKGLPEWRDVSKLSENPRSHPWTHIQSRVWWHVPGIQLLGRQRERIPGLQDWSGTLSHKLRVGTGEKTPWLKSFLSTHEDWHPHNQLGISCTPLTSPALCPWTQEDCSDLQPSSQQKKCQSGVPGKTYLKGIGGECWKRAHDTFF